MCDVLNGVSVGAVSGAHDPSLINDAPAADVAAAPLHGNLKGKKMWKVRTKVRERCQRYNEKV